jgi:cation transport ATPase
MELTWVAILASLMMALGAPCVFIFAGAMALSSVSVIANSRRLM